MTEYTYKQSIFILYKRQIKKEQEEILKNLKKDI